MEREEEKHSLNSPLVLRGVEEKAINGGYDNNNKNTNKIEEIKKQLSLAGPIVAVNVLLNCLSVISVMFVGHLGELPLSGASMATSFASVSGFSLLVGMGSALDTFCGQSYGAKQYHMLGVHKQRAMLVLLLTSVPIALIWANTGQILAFLGQDPEISAEAGDYARFMIPSIFAYALLQCHIRFLQSQKNVVPMMLSTGFTTLLHIFVCWILVFKSGLGNKGAALANAISYWVNLIILATYVRVSKSCKETWTGFSIEGLQEIPKFLWLAIPSAIMLCLETWSFEMMVLLSGFLPNPKLETSVLSICFTTAALCYMMPLGFSGATSIRVSNELGAGRSQAARSAVWVSLCLVATEGIFVATVMILGRNILGYCYSTEEEVVEYVGEVLVLVAGTHFLDGINTVLQGAIRGCGLQKVGALVNFGAFYLIGMPVGIMLAFVWHIGGKGLYSGLMLALFVQALLLAVITACTNWEKEARKASERVYASQIPKQVLS